VNRAGTIGTPTGDGGRDGAVIVRAAVAFTVSENGPATADASELSATITEKVDVPVAVGVPEMIPVAKSNESPGGRLPLNRLQVYGGLPPDAVKAAVLYGTFSVAAGRGGAVKVSPAVTLEVEPGAAATLFALSATEIVKLYVPIVVGVPLSAPVAALSVIPGGSPPPETENV
jgi:hypothetical protein